VHQDGSAEEVELADIAEYVTEARNPGNERQVARVEARAPVELLRPGVVLNRVDHLTSLEREEVARFVTEAIASELGHKERLWCLSARQAVAARLVGDAPGEDDADDFTAFYQAFSRFVELDLVEARLETARAELSRLAHELDDSLAIESVTADLDAASLAERVALLQEAAQEQRLAFEDERTLLQRDVSALIGAIEGSLAEFAAREPSKFDRDLLQLVRTTPLARLQETLRLPWRVP
jgi:hypothetical protein